MPDFFSSAPLDYGAQYIAQGYQNLGNGIAGGLKGIAENNQQEKEMKMKAALAEQARIAEADRQLAGQAVPYGGAVTDPKTGELNRIATATLIQKGEDARQRMNRALGIQDSDNIATQQGLKSLGLTPGAGTQTTLPTAASVPTFGANATPSSINDAAGAAAMAPIPTATVTPISDEQQLKQAQDANKLAQAAADDQKRTDILAKEKRSLIGASQMDQYQKATGQTPPPEHLNPDGTLNAQGLHMLNTATNKVASGYMADPDKPGTWKPVPGGPADIKQQLDQQRLVAAQADAATKQASYQQAQDALHASNQDVVANINKLIGDPANPNDKGSLGFMNTGTLLGRVSDVIPGTGGNNVHAQIAAVKAGLGLNFIRDLKASSANGNSGIGRVLEVEFNAAANAQRNLDQSQSESEIRANAEALREHIQRIEQLRGKLTPAGGPSQATPPSGWTLKQ